MDPNSCGFRVSEIKNNINLKYMKKLFFMYPVNRKKTLCCGGFLNLWIGWAMKSTKYWFTMSITCMIRIFVISYSFFDFPLSFKYYIYECGGYMHIRHQHVSFIVLHNMHKQATYLHASILAYNVVWCIWWWIYPYKLCNMEVITLSWIVISFTDNFRCLF